MRLYFNNSNNNLFAKKCHKLYILLVYHLSAKISWLFALVTVRLQSALWWVNYETALRTHNMVEGCFYFFLMFLILL